MDGEPVRWLEQVRQCKFLSERDLKKLCVTESNVKPVSSPVTVCGDIHGQFFDLLELLKHGGDPADNSYILMGDFVDRGYYSLETITLLLVLKVAYPTRITLLRGNHECRTITQVYGFYDECLQKYGNSSAWRLCCQVFDCLTLTALIDGTVLCVHGGISPEIRLVDQLRTINRNREIPNEGPFADIMWSDPDDMIGTWQLSQRGAGWVFGDRVTNEFCHASGLMLIARSHQLVMEGYKYHFSNQLVTVWSAPNYCYRCGNTAAILKMSKEKQVMTTFEASPENERVKPPHMRSVNPYFL